MPDIGLLLLTSRDGRPVYVKDVASVVVGAAEPEHRAWTMTRLANGELQRRPALTIAIAKRKGANAVAVADDVLRRLEIVKGRILPPGVEVAVTRNYGATATEKANELLFHLGLATLSIVVLITFAIGWREGLVVLIIIPTTILLTLFASWLMGYTINRVSLFALIFSIGILVDDAIVIVENIARHWSVRAGRGLVETAIEAVAEVGNPTIIATLTIVAALLPMMFVSGLMGPYMSPIPANASIAMLFSFVVAVTVTPWLLLRLAGRRHAQAGDGADHSHDIGALGRFYTALARPLLQGRWRSRIFLANRRVGDRSGLSAVRDEGRSRQAAPLRQQVGNSGRPRSAAGNEPGGNRPHADGGGAAAEGPSRADVDPGLRRRGGAVQFQRSRAPLLFARRSPARRPRGQSRRQGRSLPRQPRHRARYPPASRHLPLPSGSALKVVEVPPGPPVLATVLAEIYGPDAASRRALATKVRKGFEAVDFVVDVDDTFPKPADRLRISIDQEALEFHGVDEQAVYDTIGALLGGAPIGYSQRGGGLKPIDISVALPRSARTLDERLLSTPLPAGGTCAKAPTSNWATWSSSRGSPAPIRSTATTAASRKW